MIILVVIFHIIIISVIIIINFFIYVQKCLKDLYTSMEVLCLM